MGATVDGATAPQPLAVRLTDDDGNYVAPGAVDLGDVTIDTSDLAQETTLQDTNTALASIDGKITAVNTGAVVVSSSALPTGAATSANQTTGNTSLSGINTDSTAISAVAGATNGTAVVTDANGTLQQYLRGIVKLLITGGTIVLGAGSAAIGKLAANAGVTIGAVEIAAAQTLATVTTVTGSGVAHDGVDSGNPHKVGGRAIAHGTNPTAVAAADRTDWLFSRAGVPFVIGGHPNPVTIEAAYTAAQTDTAIVSVSSGMKIVVTRCKVVADNANTVDVGYRVGFAAANTPTTTGVVSSHPGLAPGSGVTEGNGGGILGVGGDGEDLRITSEAPTTGSLRVVVTYYTVES